MSEWPRCDSCGKFMKQLRIAASILVGMLAIMIIGSVFPQFMWATITASFALAFAMLAVALRRLWIITR